MKHVVHALGMSALLILGGCGDPKPAGRASLPPGIGDVEVVVRVVHGTLANHDVRRALAVRDDVYWRELIETEQESATEVEFVDGTRLTVGPDAKVNLDEFVFGGPPGTDRMVMTMTKGMSRFVTGSMDKAAYEIRVPGAIIGVRGTDLTVAPDPTKGTTEVYVHKGEVEIRRPDGTQRVIVRAGEASKASSQGERGITPAAPTSPEMIKTAETLRAVVAAAKDARKTASAAEPVTDADRRVAMAPPRSEFGRDRLQELAQQLRMTGGDPGATSSKTVSTPIGVAAAPGAGAVPAKASASASDTTKATAEPAGQTTANSAATNKPAAVVPESVRASNSNSSLPPPMPMPQTERAPVMPLQNGHGSSASPSRIGGG